MEAREGGGFGWGGGEGWWKMQTVTEQQLKKKKKIEALGLDLHATAHNKRIFK